MSAPALLFDLDGTLSDPGVGITRCFQHALAGLGRPVPPAETLHRLVGPPLRQGFGELLATQDAAILDEALRLYRERFAAVGLFENRLYPGVPEALERLRRAGHRLFVVTSKPHVFARRIVAHFGLDPSFENVHGSELSGRNADKGDLIREVLELEGLYAPASWMIGDRLHDVEGAVRNGVRTIAVGWGYGTAEELRAARPDHVVASLDALCALLAP